MSFDGRFVHALDQEFKRTFPQYGGRMPVITTPEARDYAAFGRAYLMGPISAVHEPKREPA